MAKAPPKKTKTTKSKAPVKKAKTKSKALAKKTTAKSKALVKKATAKSKAPAKKSKLKSKTLVKKARVKSKAPGKKATPKSKAPAKRTSAVTAKKHTTFATLAAWEGVPTDEASEEFDIMVGTNDSLELEDMFGDAPENMFIHRGSVKASGTVKLSGWDVSDDNPPTVYVIDGDLEIDGPLVVSQSDILTTLWVSGNVKCKRLACLGSGMLIVGGSLTIDDVLVTGLDDAGHLVMHGPLHVPLWVDVAYGGRGNVDFEEHPKTRFLSDHYAEQEPRGATEPMYMRADLTAEAATPLLAVEPTAIVDAILSGAPILK